MARLVTKKEKKKKTKDFRKLLNLYNRVIWLNNLLAGNANFHDYYECFLRLKKLKIK